MPEQDLAVALEQLRTEVRSGFARLEERIHELIDENERRLGVQCTYRSVTGRFTELIRQHHLTLLSYARALAGSRSAIAVIIDRCSVPSRRC